MKKMGVQVPSSEGEGQNHASAHTWIIEPDEAKRVKRMFELASQGFSISRIVEKLNTFEKRKGTDYRWTNEHVVNLLRNEAYRGDVLTSKSVQPDYLVKKRTLNKGLADQYYIEEHHPALVEPVVFERVQELLKNGVLFVHRSADRKAYIEAHPELELPGVEMPGTKTKRRKKGTKKTKRVSQHTASEREPLEGRADG